MPRQAFDFLYRLFAYGHNKVVLHAASTLSGAQRLVPYNRALPEGYTLWTQECFCKPPKLLTLAPQPQRRGTGQGAVV